MPRKKDLIATFLSFCPIVAQNPTLTLGVSTHRLMKNFENFSPILQLKNFRFKNKFSGLVVFILFQSCNIVSATTSIF